MRYPGPKERSSELLRIALGHIGPQAAAFHPITFTVWYEQSAGINPRLSAAVEPLEATKALFDDAEVERLYGEYIAPVKEADVKQMTANLQRVITGLADSASVKGERAGACGEQLGGLTEAPRSNDASRLGHELEEALAGTAEMKSSAEALQQQVAVSRGEIDTLRLALDRARREAVRDALTGTLNRKRFDLQLTSMLVQPPALGKDHCLVLLDLDHFKQVNDQHGHVVGDRVIQAAGEILRISFTDELHSTTRYGGEEFAILVPDSTPDSTHELAEKVRLRTKAMKIRRREGQDILLTVTLSAGIAATRNGDNATTFIATADDALYQSKRSERDQVTHVS